MPYIKTPREYLLPQEIERISRRCRRYSDRLLFEFVYDSGCRISEALSLTPNDIDFHNRKVRLPALKRKELEYKLVTISAAMASKLRQFCHGKKLNQKLWPISRQLAYYRMVTAARRAGISNVYPHLLRDSLATEWAKRGGDLTRLQRQLGHKRLSTTTDRYLRFSTEDIRNERDRLRI